LLHSDTLQSWESLRENPAAWQYERFGEGNNDSIGLVILEPPTVPPTQCDLPSSDISLLDNVKVHLRQQECYWWLTTGRYREMAT
jgi:hypothetical protein